MSTETDSSPLSVLTSSPAPPSRARATPEYVSTGTCTTCAGEAEASLRGGNFTEVRDPSDRVSVPDWTSAQCHHRCRTRRLQRAHPLLHRACPTGDTVGEFGGALCGAKLVKPEVLVLASGVWGSQASVRMRLRAVAVSTRWMCPARRPSELPFLPLPRPNGDSHLQEAVPEHAERILNDPAWDALATVPTEAEAAGHNAASVLDQTLGQRTLDDARNPARALTCNVRRLGEHHAPALGDKQRGPAAAEKHSRVSLRRSLEWSPPRPRPSQPDAVRAAEPNDHCCCGWQPAAMKDFARAPAAWSPPATRQLHRTTHRDGQSRTNPTALNTAARHDTRQ